jgi:hypothetical protein
LADDNAYIRYLAAKDVSAPFKAKDADETPSYLEDKARCERVQSDPVLLVRSANEEEDVWKAGSRALRKPELFWKRPQTERLALVNGVKEDGEQIAELLRYATKDLLPINAITLDEMLDVLLQYLGGQSIAERVAEAENNAARFYDGHAEWSAGKSVKALWEVIPDIPKTLSYVLLECLPENAGFESNIPSQIIEFLNADQLYPLLYRDDISLKEFRRKLYKESTNDSLRCAAVTSQRFELLDFDISELVYDLDEPAESGKRKVNELAMLAENSRGATLVQMQAICDLIDDAPKDFHSGFGKWDAIGFGKRLKTERAKRLSSRGRKGDLQSEVLDMRVYALAKRVAPIKSDGKSGELPDNLIQHRDLIVPHNPWLTYLNLRKVVRLDPWKQAIDYLPSVRGFDLPNEPADDFGEDGDQVRRQLFDLPKDVESRVENVSEQDRAQLSALSNALSTISNQMQGVETVTGKRVDTLQARVEKLVRKVNILLWFVLAILLLVLFNIK